MKWLIPTCTFFCVACNGDVGDSADDPTPLVEQFGFEDARVLTLIADSSDDLEVPRDIAFNPADTSQLWIANQATDSTTIIFDAGTDDQSAENRVDVFANHFMEEVSSIAFDDNNQFGSCQESGNTYDGVSAPNWFMGPTLWPADLDYYAAVNQNPWGSLLGSHLDMLHQSPWCMGIVWDQDNAYWVFDGRSGNLVWYDFQVDHGYGGDDHSDGLVRRHTDVELERVENVPGHMALNHETNELFIANTGAGEVLWVDASSGDDDGNLSQVLEPLDEYTEWTETDYLVFNDDFEEPSGVWLHGEVLFISDHATGEIVALDVDGAEIERIDTGASEIMGLAVGPEGKLWYVDAGSDEAYRIDPEG
jgi:DNA-binding beta-propeller fold protein YncE